jgi:hypothetical protein
MSRTPIPLDVIDVARPCPVDWNEMRGDVRVRFCKHCSLHVYTLSAMTRGEAQQLVAEAEGRLCARFYRRADGTVITSDCGGGWRLAAKRLGRWATAATAVLLSAFGVTRWSGASTTERCEKPPAAPHEQLLGRIAPPTSQPVMGQAIMGDIIAPPPATQPAIMGEIHVPPLTDQPTTQPAKSE